MTGPINSQSVDVKQELIKIVNDLKALNTTAISNLQSDIANRQLAISDYNSWIINNENAIIESQEQLSDLEALNPKYDYWIQQILDSNLPEDSNS